MVNDVSLRHFDKTTSIITKNQATIQENQKRLENKIDSIYCAIKDIEFSKLPKSKLKKVTVIPYHYKY